MKVPILTQKHHSLHHAKTRRLELVLITLLIATLIIGFVSFNFYSQNQSATSESVRLAKEELQIGQAKNAQQTIKSKLGFSLSYNKDMFNVTATEFSGEEPKDYNDSQTAVTRNYAIVDIYRPINSENDGVAKSFDSSTFEIITDRTKEFFTQKQLERGPFLTDLQVTEARYRPVTTEDVIYTELKREKVNVGDINYLKVEYSEQNRRFKPINGEEPNKTIIYYTVQNNRPYAIKMRSLNSDSANLPYFETVLKSIEYSSPAEDAQFTLNDTTTQKHKPKLTWLLVEGVDAAGENKSGIDTETIEVVAKNTPAVVRVNTGYCTEPTVSYKGKNAQLPRGCVFGHGSGFFISGDGYLGTNGHVVRLSPDDAVAGAIVLGNEKLITEALRFYYSVIGASPASVARLLPESLQVILTDPQEAADFAKTLMVAQFGAKNEYSEYALQLGKTPVAVNKQAIIGGTASASQEMFGYDEKTVKAQLKGLNFNPDDLRSPTGEFSASDVAILKANGNNFPTTILGEIDGLVSGASITVIGFPSIAESISDQFAPAKATATKGIVSAVRDDRGNGKKIIQSDVTISEGNSGGPAYDNAGKVIGLATYTLKDPDGAGRVSLMRDIADLKELLSKEGIKTGSISKTQEEWSKGLEDFLGAKYSKAIKHFDEVLLEYPPHVLAQEYIDLAQKKKANGEEASDPIANTVSFSLFILLLSAAVVVFVKVRSHRKNLPPTNSSNASGVSSSSAQSTPPTTTQPNQTIAQTPSQSIVAPKAAPTSSSVVATQAHQAGGVYYPAVDETANK